MNEYILECSGLLKTYGVVRAVNNVDLHLRPGKIIGLLGPNGSGKTTLIKMMAGLLTPTTGSIMIGGYPVGTETKRIVSYLPERTYFDMSMTAGECFDFFEDFYDDFNRDRAEEMISRLGVATNLKMKTLSKGTREKIQLICTMARDAKLFLLDEPIGGVDPAAREFIMETILGNVNKEATLVISTHLIHDIEPILDEVIFLRNGSIAMHLPCDVVREEYGKSIDEQFREVFRC